MSEVQRIAIEEWLGQPYRMICHRHNDIFVAADESERRMVGADTLEGLADLLLVWPQGTEALPPSEYVRVYSREPAA